MKTFSRLFPRLSVVAWVGFALLAQAQSYSVNKFAIAGGGGLNSTGGVYAVRGTIGQQDASGPSGGGNYTVVGGFWGLPGAVQTPGAPVLAAEQLGNNARVFWPLPATGFLLDQSLTVTGAWSQVAFPYATNATHISVTVPAAGNKFYRLRKP